MGKGKLLPEKAEILGLLCAEGTHYKYATEYLEFDRRRNKRYRRRKIVEAIEFSNNPKLLQYFRKLMDKIYIHIPQCHTGKTTARKTVIKKKAVVRDLLWWTKFGWQKWKVPKEIINGSDEEKARFIRGFYEGDGIRPGFVNNSSWRIRIASKNKSGLRQIQKLLLDLNVSLMFTLALNAERCMN